MCSSGYLIIIFVLPGIFNFVINFQGHGRWDREGGTELRVGGGIR